MAGSGIHTITHDPLTLFLPRPPTSNNLFPNSKSGRRFISPEYRAWKMHATLSLRAQGIRPAGIGGAIVMYEFKKPDNRRRDVANMEKATTDLLVQYGILQDDSLIEEIYLTRPELRLVPAPGS